jgi:hypothetical protein
MGSQLERAETTGMAERTTVSRAGRRLELIEDRVQTFEQIFRKELDRAEEHRQHVLDALGVLNGTVKSLLTEVEAIKPTVADYKEKRAEARGVGRVVKILWIVVAAVGGILATLAGALWGSHGNPGTH